MSNNWSFAQVWNQALDVDRQREYVPRDYIWASELGRGRYDRYWKMKGREPTTPPNLRARRKFEAGNLTEWVMQQVLVRAGVLQSAQEHIVYEGGSVKVTGRCDFTAGGVPTPLGENDLLGLPEAFAILAQETVNNLIEKYPEGLRNVGIEIKSCAGTMFEFYEKSPSLHHALQSFHYAHTMRKPFLLVYVSRDDLRVCEWLILPDAEKWKALYDKDIEAMAEFLDHPADKVPMEPLLIESDGKYKKNFEVEYSSYLTDYGFERPDLYADEARKVTARINNVIKKIKAGSKITAINEKAIEDTVAFWPPMQDIISELRAEHANGENPEGETK